MKIITVVGARPNFMKAAPIIAAIEKHNEELGRSRQDPSCKIDHMLVHTGQHYDSLMSDSFFRDLGLPVPDVRLGVGSGSHAIQTAEVLRKFEEVLLVERPDVVIVVGDVNSTVACAMATAKIAFDSAGTRPLLAHVEAGLRSFDRLMPEEVNRVVTDHISDVLFATEESGVRNLSREGVAPEVVHFVGNTMIDSLLAFRERAECSPILERLGLGRQGEDMAPSVDPYAVLTLHRPSNVDSRDTFLNILGGLEDLAAEYPVVFPVHPRTQRQIKEFGLESYFKMAVNTNAGAEKESAANRKGVILTDPMGYLDFVCLMSNAMIAVTDSGGIQEETTCLGVPCVTVRDNTERPVTIESGTNVLGGTTKDGIKRAIRRQMERRPENGMPEKWDGRAASRILNILIQTSADRPSPQEVAVLESKI